MITSRVEQLAIAASLPTGLIIGLLDAHAEEVQPAVLLLVLAGGALGALAPRVALAVGVTLGLGVPLVQAYVRLAHLVLPYSTNGYAGTFVALIPPTIAALLGAWARQAMAHP